MVNAAGGAPEQEPKKADARKSKAKRACELIDEATQAGVLELFASDVDETPHATIAIAGNGVIKTHSETHAVKGGGFSKFLRRRFWAETEEPLFGDALTAALAHAEMRALYGDARELHVRVAHRNGAVIVDAGDAAWGAYEITAGGWRYVDQHPVPFVRGRTTVAFATPVQGQALIPLLKQLFGLEDEQARLVASWVVGAYCDGPYLVLVLHGEQGSGKTTVARAARLLTDPSAVPLRTPPRESRDLIAGARVSHVLAYDNLSSLPQWLSDGLSMIATGGGYEARTLYTDFDAVFMKLRRPVLLNGIENVAVSADLLDRSVLSSMKPISEKTRRSEEEIEADLVDVGGALVGAVFDAVAQALAGLEATPKPRWSRMIDATRWALAAASKLGASRAELERTLRANLTQRDELVLEGSVFAAALIELAMARGQWEGTTAGLKTALETETEPGRTNLLNKQVWPQSHQAVTGRLSREAPVLRRFGVTWEKTPGHGVRKRVLTFRPLVPPEPTDNGEVRWEWLGAEGAWRSHEREPAPFWDGVQALRKASS